MDDPALKWAKIHKKALVKEYLSKYEYPSSDTPNVIFMAGLPGAGKTEFAKRLAPQLATPPLHIDMDEIAEHIEDYKPRVAHLFRAGATIILERLYDQAILKRIDILLDGTFAHHKALQNIQRAFDHNYSARIYFICPDPLTAWQKTQERETVEKRSIKASDFVEAYFQLLENLHRVCETFKDSAPISVVLKHEDNRLKEIIENIGRVENYLNPALTRQELLVKITT